MNESLSTHQDLKTLFLYKNCYDRSSEELFAASPEGPKRVRQPQLNVKAIPKKCSKVTDLFANISHLSYVLSEPTVRPTTRSTARPTSRSTQGGRLLQKCNNA